MKNFFLKHKKIKTLLWGILLIFLSLGLTYNHLWGPTVNQSDDVLELTMVYGSEKRSWIHEITPLFKAHWEEQNPGKLIDLKFETSGSGGSMLDILSGAIKPVIWSPASSFWVTIANHLWLNQIGMQEDLILANESFKIIFSPIVIVTWEDYAAENNITGFSSLHDLAIQENPTIKFAHTNPLLSNSGFLATILLTTVASQKNSSLLSLDDLMNSTTQEWITELESSAEDYGSSTGFLAKQAVESGPYGLNVLIIYENLVISTNQEGGPESRWGQKLVAIYPEEGTILSDHVFCILNLPTISEEQKQAALDFHEFLISEEIQQIAMKTGFRPINNNVTLDSSIFNSIYGVSVNPGIPYLTPPIAGEVLWRIPDLWLLTKNR
ncbi:MAG: substrate-binding domain-containing protein [Candidatus Ranarchaeia archaeon]